MKYQELGYTPPKLTAKIAADRAIAILEDIAAIDEGCLFYTMQASNILALAGLRAQSPYNGFEPSFSLERRHLLANLLNSHGCKIMLEKDPYSVDDREAFSIICKQAFKELPERYTSIRSFWKEPHNVGNYTDFVFWSTYFQTSLVEQMIDNKLPKDWLLDWWAPHNIRFGMLLGYPGQAISSYCWDETQHFNGQIIKPELTPSIPFQGIYGGTHVNYDYSSAIKDLSILKATENLWTDILKLVYKAFPENRTLKYPEFRAEYERFKKYDETV